ncbi:MULTISPECIES: hypothetical protein [Phaeobacter]|uniref:hypothetical protein n=1 Tax=Phaeobacter TaxID=302485 RepID=UPI0003D69FBF|nr:MULTISPECIES: hypothetical protein [Phaeobacter]AHD12154.1 hypothetical protein Gal_04450 [Phaeobacter gallaeciensis DSM 26640]ATE95338.1 hypothetical protein PhaeoP11_04354 [Phaeobacter gallaeciensis]AUR38361.1 hypothetical protein PhaeoP18_04145 [Phaeobacter piscinae]
MNEQNSGGFGKSTVRAVGSKQDIDVWGLICWAFQRECVSLDRQEEATGVESRINVDPIYQMVEIARLGCRVQGGGRSASHHDAEIVAGTLAVLPEYCGGWAMATTIAELARAGRVPEWDITPVVYPVDTFTNRWGTYARTEDAKDLGAEGWPHQPETNRKGRAVYRPVPYCPVVIRPTAGQIGRARRLYLNWYGALLEIRMALQTTHLTAFKVTDRMPPRAPWKESGLTKS